MAVINSKVLKKYTKKELKKLGDGKIYIKKLEVVSRRIWMKEVTALGEECFTYILRFNELENILKEAKNRAKSIKKLQKKGSPMYKKPIFMIASHITPEFTLVLTEREIK